MKRPSCSAVSRGLTMSLFVLPCLQTASAADENPASIRSTLEEVIVIGVRRGEADTPLETGIEPVRVQAVDSAGLVALLPGGALVNNGAVSGQIQFRGLSGARITVTVDGQRFGSGGPNLMDPAMQYAPLTLLSSLDVARSIGSVSAGPGLAGLVNARYKMVDFSAGSELSSAGSFTLIGRSGDASKAAGGVAGASNNLFRFHVLGSREEGDNLDFPDGEIANTFHDRQVYGVGAGLRSKDGRHTYSLTVRRHETGDTGNPPFAMDIEVIEGDFVTASWTGKFDLASFGLDFTHADIFHAMTNYRSRPSPAMMMQRRTLATGETTTYAGHMSLPFKGGDLRLGLDYEENIHDVTITNPDNVDFFLNSLPDITMERTGWYAEWFRESESGGLELGIRNDQVSAQSGQASVGSGVPTMPGMLAMAFNAADRKWEDSTVDAVLQAWYHVGDKATLRGTVARKTRAPGYVERFAWLPTPASGGLADGNTYVGDLGLTPETAFILEAGIDIHLNRFTARPTLFYRRIDDYIQGVAYDDTIGIIDSTVEMVSNMNGDPTPLRFANVDAKLAGFDVDFSWTLTEALDLEGGLSYVEGKRQDINDDLYRIAPLRGRLALTWTSGSWYVTGEGQFAAEQSNVSATNSEAETDGHAILNIFGGWAVNQNLFVNVGVTNLLDEAYEDHLAGYNRIADSDVPLRSRLPGAGINGFVRLEYVF